MPDSSSARVAALAIMLAAPVFALLTLQIPEGFSRLLFFSLPVLAAAGVVSVSGILSGFNIRKAWTKMSRISRIGLAAFLASTIFANLTAVAAPQFARLYLFSTLLVALTGWIVWFMSTDRWRAARGPLLHAMWLGALLYICVLVPYAWVRAADPAFDWIAFGLAVTNLRQTAFYAIPLVTIAGGFAHFAATGRGRGTLYVAQAAGFGLAAFSGGRAAFAACLIAAGAGAVLAGGRRLRNLLLTTLAATAGAAATIVLSPDGSTGWGRIFAKGMTESKTQSVMSGREAFWAETATRIADHPWFGHGEGQFRHVVAVAEQSYNHPHNSVLQFLFQWGVVGTLAVALMLLPTLLALPAKLKAERRLAVPCISLVLAMAMMSMFEGSFFHVYPSLLTVICLAILASCAAKSTLRQ
ncbi:O-antigen ligase family protein [Altererythrobacter sp. CAU 1778]